MATPLTHFIDKVLERRILAHCLYWVGVVMIWAVPRSFEGGYEPLINKLCYLPPQIFVSYFLLYYQIPQLLFKKRYIRFAISVTFSLYIGSVWARIMKIYVYETVITSDLPKDPLYNIFTEPEPLLFQYLLWIVITPVITLLVKYVKDHFQTRSRIAELKKEKVHAELNFLRAQIHPHFLFNTLNNLYTLTLSKSEKAPEVVKKLSDILAYMFYQGNQGKVTIKEEVELLQNYIDLEKLRYGDRLELMFNKQIDDPTTHISPLVFLSVVENAFKHGASGDIGSPKIHIDLKLNRKKLFFKVFNTKPSLIQKDEQNYKKGIGVSNIKRQLELLHPDHYELVTEESETTYLVTLTIDLEKMNPLSIEDKVYA